MRVRRLLVLTAIVSSILGATAVYLFLTVPNDLQAGALLKEARAHIAAGRTAQAHDTLVRVIQQYPRTDAAAAATVALVKLEEQQREQIQGEIGKLREEQAAQTKALGDVRKTVEEMRAAPAKSTPAVDAPAKKTPTKKVTSKKVTSKKTPAKKPPARRRKR